MFIRFDMIHKCDRHTDTTWRERPRLCIASHSKSDVNTAEITHVLWPKNSRLKNWKRRRLERKKGKSYFVTPGVEPTLHALHRLRLLITLLFPVFGKPEIHAYQSDFLTQTKHYVRGAINVGMTSLNILLLVCVSWTITGQPQNSVFIGRV